MHWIEVAVNAKQRDWDNVGFSVDGDNSWFSIIPLNRVIHISENSDGSASVAYIGLDGRSEREFARFAWRDIRLALRNAIVP